MYTTPSPCVYHAHPESCTCCASTSLVELETTVRNALKMTAVQSRYFKDLVVEREKILTVLIKNDTGQMQGRINRVMDCCAYPRVMATKFDCPVLVVGRCKDRMCPRCARHNAWVMSKRLEEIMSRMNSRRMITFTLRHREGSLKSQIDRLMLGWRKIRKTGLWKEHVHGGIYSLEVTYDQDNRNWHPHLHVIVEGHYFDQKCLSKLWEKVTGDSPVVDIRSVKSIKQTGRYISKYVTKPDEVAKWNDDILYEYMMAIRGRRLFHAFGCLHNIKTTEKEDKLIQREGCGYTSIAVMVMGYQRGVVECIRLWAFLKFAPKQWRIAFGIDDDVPGMHDSEVETLDMKQLSDLLDAATWVLRPNYTPTIPKPKPIPTLWTD